MRILVVDDEAPARAKLRRLLSAERDVELVGEASSGAEAVEAVMRLKPDLLLLDVQMPGMDGFEVVASIPTTHMPRTVFITAHMQHAIRAFEVRAIDYLLKPVTPGRFAAMLGRVREELERRGPDSTLLARIQDAARTLSGESRYLKRLLIQGKTKTFFLLIEHIDWVDVAGNYLRLRVGATVHVERGSLTDFVARLDPGQFLRINRSQAVRLDAIKELHPWSHGDYRLVLRDGTTLTWSRRFRAVSMAAFRPR
jgi:two-component system LytT family response regulator